MKETKFYLIADPHYFETSLGCSGKEYDDFMHFEQKCFAETASINRSVIDYLKEAQEADTVLIAGDLTFNGEKESHKSFIKLLHELKDSGKKIFVVTADHDFKQGKDCFAFGENGRYNPETINRDDLWDMYSDFGFGQAIAEDRKHLSYVAQLSDGVRLLALNSDFKKKGQFHFEEEQLEWIKEQAEKAKEDGQLLFAMNHYPIIGGQPLMELISSMTVYDSDKVAAFLADNGINMIFTGHMHNHSIAEKITEKGNKLYDICTGAIIADPAYIRLVTVKDDNTADIKSIPTPDFDFDTKGKDCKTYLSDMFDNMIVNVLTDLRDDPERVINKFHIKNTGAIRFALRFVGRIICGITLGTLARLLFIKCDKSIRKMKLKDYAVNIVRQMFEGNQPYVEGTPEGDLFLAFLKRIGFVLKKLSLKKPDGTKADMYEVLKHTVGNYGIDDYDAVLKLR